MWLGIQNWIQIWTDKRLDCNGAFQADMSYNVKKADVDELCANIIPQLLQLQLMNDDEEIITDVRWRSKVKVECGIILICWGSLCHQQLFSVLELSFYVKLIFSGPKCHFTLFSLVSSYFITRFPSLRFFLFQSLEAKDRWVIRQWCLQPLF